MNTIKSKLIIICFVALLLTFCASATVRVSVGVSNGNGAASGSSIMNLGKEDAISAERTLSFDGSASIASSGSLQLAGAGWQNEYSSWTADGRMAAVYAFMDDPTSYTYSVNGGVCSCGSLVALESVTAKNAENLLFGGFAYNKNDYAAVQIKGRADRISYSNLVGATLSKAVASQSFSADGADLNSWSWAERGDHSNEIQSEMDVQNAFEGYKDPGPLGGTGLDMSIGQMASFTKGYIKSYSSYAISNANSPYVTQSATLARADSAEFNGAAKIGDKDLTGGNAWVTGGAGLTYSGKAQNSNGKLTTTQSLKADSADSANMGMEAKTGADAISAKMDVSNAVKLSYTSAGTKDTKGALTGSQSLKGDSADSASMGMEAKTGVDAISAKTDVSNVVKLSYASAGTKDKKGTLTGSQSFGAKIADLAKFEGAANIGTDDAIAMNAQVSAGDAISFSSSTKDSAGVLSGSQSLSAKNANFISRSATAQNLKGDLYFAGASVKVDSDLVPTAILATMTSGTDSITAKDGYASVTQKMNAKGAVIFREIKANDGPINVISRADTLIFALRDPEKASSLSGQSVATISSSGASVKGSWKVGLAKDVTGAAGDSFQRSIHAKYGLLEANPTIPPVSSTNKAISFSFKEDASATAVGASAK